MLLFSVRPSLAKFPIFKSLLLHDEYLKLMQVINNKRFALILSYLQASSYGLNATS